MTACYFIENLLLLRGLLPLLEGLERLLLAGEQGAGKSTLFRTTLVTAVLLGDFRAHESGGFETQSTMHWGKCKDAFSARIIKVCCLMQVVCSSPALGFLSSYEFGTR